MNYETLEREIFIEAAPEVVFEVVSRPEHVRRWWPDDANYELKPGSTGEIVFGDPEQGGAVVSLSVMEVDPPRSFSFRWTHPSGATAKQGNSLLVTFELTPSGDGTRLKLTESGFRELGWDQDRLEAEYEDHVNGWTHFLGQLAPYVATLAVGS
jgi:uncharacterized protein YndB with AHSA1/START domain